MFFIYLISAVEIIDKIHRAVDITIYNWLCVIYENQLNIFVSGFIFCTTRLASQLHCIT